MLVVGFGSAGIVNAVFPRLHNDLSCSDSAPENAAQRAALQDARSRASAVCLEPGTKCIFVVGADPFLDTSLRVSPVVVETDFFEGCLYRDSSLDSFIYDSNGKFMRTEGAPYAID